MSNIANKLTCFCLDSIWRPIGHKTTKDAIISLCGEPNRQPTWMALDIVYAENDPSLWDDKGKWDFDNCLYMNPTKWDDWIKLPVREFDFVIHTGRGQEIRVPTVIVSQKFCKTVFRDMKFTKNNIRLRDNNTCQYTGKKLKPEEGNVDHVLPRSRGGADTWENVVWCCKKVNSQKDNKTPKEAGLTLLRKPFKPAPEMLGSAKSKLVGHKDWNLFLNK